MDHSLCTCWLAKGHWDYFHFLVIMTNAAVNTRVQACVRTSVFCSLGRAARSDIAGWCGDSVPDFSGGTVTSCTSSSSAWGLRPLRILASPCQPAFQL